MRRNLETLALLENPWRNPRRRGRKRNPARALAMPQPVRGWMQGVDLMDAGAALGGLAASTTIPAMLVKDTTTMGGKLLKLVASLGSALAAGQLGKMVISPSAGKAAVIGGVAGTAAQALGMFTSIKIGGSQRLLGPGRSIGAQEIISPPMTREEEVVSLIQP